MPELNMISPLLTNMELVKCVSVHGGTSVYIVKSTKSNQSYYLKHICIPESQKQVDALMFTGAAATVEDAQNYYKQVAADYQAELETLETLSASPNIGCYRSYQIEPKEDGLDMDEAFRRVSHVFGIVKLSRAVECPKDFDAVCETAEAYLGETLRGVRTFKVEAKRADKAYPMKSPEICRELGAYLLDKHHHLRVDVHNPQLEIMVEIRDHAAYVHGPKVEAAGGLPVGTSGRALNLLSGGIDSPVAAWCMARRGLALHHIHFASPPYTSLRAKLKVRDLAREIVEYTGNCTLFVVPYTKPQEYIRDNAPDVLFTVLMRRSMLRIANQVAKKLELQALITGESLAQVASQTMAALACTDQAQDLPVLRPCIGMDKIEIINISRKIGTFETSIEPYEDCCTIFTPPHPKTNPTLDEILAAEAAMPDLAALETEAAENVEKIYIRMGEDELL